MSKPPPARYRTTNWSSYNASLRKRGSLLIRVDKDMILRAPHDGRPGRPPVFSDAAIQFCLSIKVLFKLPLRQDEQIGTVTADGAYETRRCHTAIIDRQGTAIIPIRTNGRLWKEDCPAAHARNETLRVTRHYGRAFWKRWTGYHTRSRIKARMRCLKAFGERIAARDPDRQTAEIHFRIALMNRFNAFGTAAIIHLP
ncbi:hypothetical protein DQW77_17475 [Roseovarius sp. TE539]|uniref:transposase n=1 Tax=Roseovarius sp. TE539 TaxID=2249812 RepID=UPI000DE08FBF|nr:transposase [Roseovarius sp. TE539]RBI67552.1 hypothetical protein DQW77_17475 [Roseovarius sp. TE539]